MLELKWGLCIAFNYSRNKVCITPQICPYSFSYCLDIGTWISFDYMWEVPRSWLHSPIHSSWSDIISWTLDYIFMQSGSKLTKSQLVVQLINLIVLLSIMIRWLISFIILHPFTNKSQSLGKSQQIKWLELKDKGCFPFMCPHSFYMHHVYCIVYVPLVVACPYFTQWKHLYLVILLLVLSLLSLI